MEKHIAIIEDSFLKENIKLFSDERCRITKTIIDDDLFKDDDFRNKLVKAKQKAEKELRDYEFNIRHNIK